MSDKELKMTLIRPASLIAGDSVSSNFGVPSLSLAYLASSLDKENISYQVIDAQALGLDEFNYFKTVAGIDLYTRGASNQKVINLISRRESIICISCMFSNEWLHVRELVKEIKLRFPNRYIVLGGEHVTANPEQVLQDLPYSRILCAIGEGDDLIIDIYKKLSTSADLASISSVAYLEDNRVHKTARLPRKTQLDDLKPNWDKVPIRPYLDKGYSYGAHNKRSMPMLFSRGCPYQCTFCTSPNMWGTRWVYKKPEIIGKEIGEYIGKYDIEHIDFFDLTTAINRKAIIELSNEIKKHNISWAMPSGTRSEVLDKEVLQNLKESGLVRIQYAPESGSSDTLKRIKKRVNLDKMSKSIREAYKLGICTRATMIFGFPGQTLTECFESFLYSMKLAFIGLDDLACYPFVPYCGSELFDQLVKEGEFEELEYLDLAHFQAIHIYNRAKGMKSYSKSIPDFLMPLFVLGLMGLFYLVSYTIRPWKVVLMIRNLIIRKPVTSIDLLVRGYFIRKWQLVSMTISRFTKML